MTTFLHPPNHNDSWLDEIINNRRKEKAALSAVLSVWKQRYQDYLTFVSSNSSIGQTPPTLADLKTILIEMYEKPSVIVRDKIKKTILDASKDFCPYCGRIGTPDTLDHFAHKDLLPEFSIYAYNLISTCFTCNTKIKHTKPCEINGQRQFVHPYFDEFCAKKVLEIQMKMTARIPVFKVKPTSLLTQTEASIVQAHIDNLKLDERLNIYFFKEVDSVRDFATDLIANGKTTQFVLDHYQTRLGGYERKSPNHSLAILYRFLLNNTILQTYIFTPK